MCIMQTVYYSLTFSSGRCTVIVLTYVKYRSRVRTIVRPKRELPTNKPTLLIVEPFQNNARIKLTNNEGRFSSRLAWWFVKGIHRP